jgi:hypothetical protein
MSTRTITIMHTIIRLTIPTAIRMTTFMAARSP